MSKWLPLTAVEEMMRLQEEANNLKALLMDRGNHLVRNHGFRPAQAISDRKKDAAFLRSTQMIAMFVAWLNNVAEAQRTPAEYGWEWPLGQFRGKAKDDFAAIE